MELRPGNPVAAAIVGRWQDSLSPAMAGTGAAALTIQAITAGGAIRGVHMRHDQDDAVDYSTEIGHAWDLGEVRLHVHWIPMANPAADQVVRWQYYYRWATTTALGVESTGTVDVTVSPGTNGRVINTHLANISPPASPTASTFLLYRLIRQGTSVSDTYTTSNPTGTAQANVLLLGSGVHYQASRYGTATETA